VRAVGGGERDRLVGTLSTQIELVTF
jgi:hypothetical protein